MSRKSEIFESVLTSAYDNNAFVGFVQELLNNVELVAPNAYKKVYNNFSYYVDGYYHIGNYTGNDGGKIAIFSVALKKGDSVERARTMQRNFVKPLLENGMCAGALVAFYTPEEVQKYYLTDNISQGDILYLDDELYLQENNTPRSRHHLEKRIVMQGITGVNEKYRLKMTLADEGIYCANSVNYLLCGEKSFYFLGLLNSHLLNWYFAKLSTNSNVNGYEVDNIPVKIAEDTDVFDAIEKLVIKLLEEPNNKGIEDELNDLVYELYEVSLEEQKIIEARY